MLCRPWCGCRWSETHRHKRNDSNGGWYRVFCLACPCRYQARRKGEMRCISSLQICLYLNGCALDKHCHLKRSRRVACNDVEVFYGISTPLSQMPRLRCRRDYDGVYVHSSPCAIEANATVYQ